MILDRPVQLKVTVLHRIDHQMLSQAVLMLQKIRYKYCVMMCTYVLLQTTT